MRRQRGTPSMEAADGVPAHCRLNGVMAPIDTASTARPINFSVVLPASWSRRAAQLGGGGMNGIVPNLTGGGPGAQRLSLLDRGFATYGSDSGHQASFGGRRGVPHDMHGNVFEWVEDCYEADRAHTPEDGSPNKEGNCANRVFRDGTFLSNPYMQRSARRGAPYPATQRGRNYLGFRVAKTLD